MPLYVYNLTESDIQIPVRGGRTFTIPKSNLTGFRGPVVNLTSELHPSIEVDQVYGIEGGLSAGKFNEINNLIISKKIDMEWFGYKEYSTGNLSPRSTASVEETIHVGKSGSVDYSSIKDACESIVDSSMEKPYNIIVHAGRYEEDPFSIPPFTTINGVGGSRRQMVVAKNNFSDFINVTQFSSGIQNIIILGPTDASSIVINSSGVSFNIFNCGFSGGKYCVKCSPTISESRVRLRMSFLCPWGQPPNNFVKCTGYGDVIADGVICENSSTVNDFYVDGENAKLTLMNVYSNGVNGVYADDGANLILNGCEFAGGDTAIWIGASGETNSIINNCIAGRDLYNTAVKIESVNSKTYISGGNLNLSKMEIIDGANFSASFSNNCAGNGYVVWGELFTGNKDGFTPLKSLTRDFFSSGLESGGVVSKHIDGAHVSSGSAWVEKDGIPKKVSWNDEIILDIPNNKKSHIYVCQNGTVSHSVTEPNSYCCVLAVVVKYNNEITFISENTKPVSQLREQIYNYIGKVIGPISYAGSITTENSPPSRKLDVSSGKFFIHDKQCDVDSTSQIEYSLWYRGGVGCDGWDSIQGNTEIDNLNFDDGSGSIVEMDNGKFRKDLLFLTYPKSFHLVIGQEEFDSLNDAENGNDPNIPQVFSKNSMVISAIIIEKGGNISKIIDRRPKIGQGSSSGSSGVSSHGDLLGLEDDDHQQYLLTNGSREFTGDVSLGGNALTNVGHIDGVIVTNHRARHILGGLDEINGDRLGVNYVPENYDRIVSVSHNPSAKHLTSHLMGVDEKIGQIQHSRMYYGRVPTALPFYNHPATADSVGNIMQSRGNAKISHEFDLYRVCKFRTQIVDNDYDKITFNSIQDVADYTNSNVGFDLDSKKFTESCWIYPYDEIDYDIPPPYIFGRNSTRSRLIKWTPKPGKKPRYYSQVKYVHSDPRWPQCDEFLSRAFEVHQWADPITPELTPIQRSGFWMPSSKKNLYAIRRHNNFIKQDLKFGSTGRSGWRSGVGFFTISDFLSCYPWMTHNGSGDLVPADGKIIFVDPNGDIVDERQLPRTSGVVELLSGNFSGTMCIPVASLTGSDRFLSVMLKPLCIDVLDFRSFDTSKLRLECVYKRESDGQHRFNVVDLDGSRHSEGWYCSNVRIGQFINLTKPGRPTNNRYRPSTVRFRFRDLTTNKVGPLSTASLTWRFCGVPGYLPELTTIIDK